jgi:hypothetical protein
VNRKIVNFIDSPNGANYKGGSGTAIHERRTNMGAQPVPLSPPLSQGSEIEYRAFARTFDEGPAAVLMLIATCFYPTSGWTIYFKPGEGLHQFDLLEKPPSGIFNPLVTYNSASWATGQRLADPPASVTITDAGGEHDVEVEVWT